MIMPSLLLSAGIIILEEMYLKKRMLIGIKREMSIATFNAS